mgnify:CR=1 FL=1
MSKKSRIYLAHIFKSPTFASAFENGSGDRLTFWQKRSKNPYFFLFLWGCFFRNFLLRKEKWKKPSDLFGRYEIKFLPLHPLSKRKQALIEILFTRRAVTTFLYFFVLPFARETTGKRKRKKTSGNIWKICLKVLTFAPAFREEADARSASLIEAALRTSSSFISLSQRETTRKRKKEKKLSKLFGRYT